MIVQADEFTGPITIGSIAFDAVPGTGEETTLYELYVDMGYCSSSELGTVYEENYIPGTKERVFQSSTSVVVSASSPEIVLDVPFLFDPSNGNLLVDVIWPDGEGEFYTFNFATSEVSSIAGAYDLAEGFAFTDMSHIFLSTEFSLNQITFAGAKKIFSL